MGDLCIKLETGEMVIHLDSFFPTSQERLKKLIKIIQLDRLHSDELIEDLEIYFQDKIRDTETNFQHYGRKSSYFEEQIEAVSRVVKNKKYPNGVSLSKEELKSEKDKLKSYRKLKQDYSLKAIKNKKEQKKYLKHLIFLTA